MGRPRRLCATDAFRAYHGPTGKAIKTLESYYVGELIEATASAPAGVGEETSASSAPSASSVVPAHVTAFRELVAGLEGELHTDYVHYAKLAACLSTLLATAVYCVAAPGTGFWTHMLGAVLLGLFWQQTMFIGHDAGHGAITHDHKKDFLIGLVVGNLCNGVGITW